MNLYMSRKPKKFVYTIASGRETKTESKNSESLFITSVFSAEKSPDKSFIILGVDKTISGGQCNNKRKTHRICLSVKNNCI